MLYDDADSRRSMGGFEQDSVELKVSKRAFDCPEVDFWNSEAVNDDDDFKITTSAPSLDDVSRGAGKGSTSSNHFGSSSSYGSTNLLPNKKRKIQSIRTGSTGSHVASASEARSQAGAALVETESPDFVAPVEWKMIKSEITKDLKVGEWAFDCTTSDMWWSIEVFQIFDMDPNRAKPTFASYKKLLHQDDKDLVLFLFQRALEKGVPYEVSHRFIMPGDKIKWCRVKCRVQLDNSRNSVSKLYGTIQDITLWSKSVIDGRKQNLNAFVDEKQPVAKGM